MLQSITDGMRGRGVELDEGEISDIQKSIITPYIINQMSLLGNDLSKRIGSDNTPEGGFGKIRGVITNISGMESRISMLYSDGVLDIEDTYAPITDISNDLSAKLSWSPNRLEKEAISQDDFDKIVQFARDNLFKVIKSGNRFGKDTIAAQLYEVSSPKDKEFMREALLNSLKDEELVSLIQLDFSGIGTSSDTLDVIAGISHLTLAIYESMLRNGDIDSLVDFFSDENMPIGVLHKSLYDDMPFYFLAANMGVVEFGSHVDTFLSGGEILRKAGIEALSYINPRHPSLLAMVETEQSPDVMELLAKMLPVTAIETLMGRSLDMNESIDIDTLYQKAYHAYGEEHGVLDTGEDYYEALPQPELADLEAERDKAVEERNNPYASETEKNVSAEKVTALRDKIDAIYQEYSIYTDDTEKETKQERYAIKFTALERKAKSTFESAFKLSESRLETMQMAGVEMDSIESFHSIFEEQHDEPKDTQFFFDDWANNLSDEFRSILAKGFSKNYYKPGLPELFDELYYGTLFGKMHRSSKGDWEESSSSPWGGALKESVGRQFDDEVIFHSGMKTKKTIDEELEKERRMLFQPDNIRSANFHQENLDKYVRMHKQMTRALLDVAVPDSDTIDVYRGTSNNELSDEQYNTLNPNDFLAANIQSNSLSSYSLNEGTAQEHFAERKDNGIVINIPALHKDNIWSTFFSHSYEGGEREILVINHSDMDAYVKTTYGEIEIDTSSFFPDNMTLTEIKNFYGTGAFTEANDYIDEFSSVSELGEYIEEEINSGTYDELEEYLNSSQRDDDEISNWAYEAAYWILNDAKKNYDYKLNLSYDHEEAIRVVENFGFLGEIYSPYDVLGSYDDYANRYDDYANLSQSIFAKQKNLWDEDGPTYVPIDSSITSSTGEIVLEYDLTEKQKLKELKDEADRIARNLVEWANEGAEKVAGI